MESSGCGDLQGSKSIYRHKLKGDFLRVEGRVDLRVS
jgi:hypothetical protein